MLLAGSSASQFSLPGLLPAKQPSPSTARGCSQHIQPVWDGCSSAQPSPLILQGAFSFPCTSPGAGDLLCLSCRASVLLKVLEMFRSQRGLCCTSYRLEVLEELSEGCIHSYLLRKAPRFFKRGPAEERDLLIALSPQCKPQENKGNQFCQGGEEEGREK